MDLRDKWLHRHHQRRLAVCQRCSLERQIQDAERHLEIARNQYRFAYAMQMYLWLGSLRPAK